MKRRELLVGFGGVLGGWPLAGLAQNAATVRRIGRLSPLSSAAEGSIIAGLRQGLGELGWTENENFAFEFRFADGRPERLPQLAADLVRLKVDVIVAGSNPGGLAAKRATREIPIVVVTSGDPIRFGLVDSLARPGGNVTGVTALGTELSAKRFELLREAVPTATRMALLTNPTSPETASFVRAIEAPARAQGVELHVIEAREPGEIDNAFAQIGRLKVGALMVFTDPMFITQRRQIVDLAARTGLPGTYGERDFVNIGGLMFYGASLPDMYRRAAIHIDKIFRGARPADLPFEQPTKFDLIVNLKAARALGITIPQSILLRADEVIE